MADKLALPGLPRDTDAETDRLEGFSLEEMARFAAQLAAAGPERAQVLRARGVDEASWALAEVGWMTRIARKAFAGDRSLLDAYRIAGDDELAAIGKRRELPSIELWQRAEVLRGAGKTDVEIARAL